MSRPLILLVEESPFFLEVEKGFLRRTDADILTAANGRDALNQIKNHPPSLVFMALDLAGFDGAACCAAIKADPATCKVPVVLIGNGADAKAQVRCRAAGCDGILTKPLERHPFLEMGRRFLQQVDRRIPRLPVKVPVFFRIGSEGFYGMSEDLSESGIYIAFDGKAVMGDRVLLSFLVPGSKSDVIEATGRIARIHGGGGVDAFGFAKGVGVKFEEIAPDSVALLKQCLQPLTA